MNLEMPMEINQKAWNNSRNIIKQRVHGFQASTVTNIPYSSESGLKKHDDELLCSLIIDYVN